MGELYEKAGGKLTILSVNIGSRQTPEKVTAYRDHHKIPYDVLFDEGTQVTRSYGIRGIPTFIVVDEAGVIRYRNYVMPPEYMEVIEEDSQ